MKQTASLANVYKCFKIYVLLNIRFLFYNVIRINKGAYVRESKDNF